MCRVSQAKFDEGLQHNTCRIYQVEQQTFQRFCAQYHLTAFPASEDTLMVFTTYLDEHLQRHYTTVHHYMVAIHAAHIALGLSNPCRIALICNSYFRWFAVNNHSPCQTQANKASPQSSLGKPGLYTGSTSPRTVFYGQPWHLATIASLAVVS